MDVARDAAGDVERAAVRQHVENCTACSARLRRERALTEGLRALDRATPGDGPSSAVESALMSAFLEQQAGSRARPAEDSRSWLRWAAAAALVVAALGGATVWRQSEVVPSPENPPLEARPLPLAKAVGPIQAAVTSVPVSQAAAVEARARRATGRAGDPSLAAVATGRPGDFVPWPGAAALPPFENGELVRTEVPASVLPLLGIGGATPAAARVPVDVVVGQDGYARAVRLAHQ